MQNSQALETYLAQIAHELRDLPDSARADEMREIETHLRAMIEVRGDVAAVVAQFGAPHKVGRDLRKAWERKQPEAWWRGGISTFVGIAAYAVGLTSWASILFLFTDDQGFVKTPPDIYLVAYASLMALISGAISGSISPKRGWLMGTLASLVCICFFSFLYLSDATDCNEAFDVLSRLLSFWIGQALSFQIGIYFGARRGRRISSRIAKAK